MAGWNGKLQAVGNGGWNGNIDTNALAGAVRRGYAGTSTDTGHQGGAGPWMQNPEKLADWAYRSVHETAVAAKALINAFYGEATVDNGGVIARVRSHDMSRIPRPASATDRLTVYQSYSAR